MKQMTYTEAATCGENLKVRTTPEQSEKMQQAWFAAGRKWIYESTEILNTGKPYLFLRHYLTASSSDLHFSEAFCEEIELIDDIDQPKKCECGKILTSTELEYYEHSCEECESKVDYFGDNDQKQPDFASQQDVWSWVTQGHKVESINNSNIYGFKDGEMFLYSQNTPVMSCDFSKYWNWQKHTLTSLIRVNGVEVPAPLESIDGLDIVWVAKPCYGHKAEAVNVHRDADYAQGMLELGLLYATKEDAIKRAEAMVKFEVVE